ncbi:MAG: hypothetical protein F4Z29_05475 [Gemmatimonadetes bacterium]|nr:hypothetical protein [Gemmatimonadota bacterium]
MTRTMKSVRNPSIVLSAFSVLVLVFLTTCGKDSPTKPQAPDPPQPPPPAPLVATRIVITPPSATLNAIGETVRLTAQVFDQNSSDMSGAVVTWQSSSSAVATVGGQGLVTAVSNGRVTITARSGNASATAAVTVSQSAASIRVEPASTTLKALRETVQLTATVHDGNGQPVKDAAVSWQSSDSAVATVSNQGLVTAVGNGRVTITAQAGNASANAEISVMQAPGTIHVEPEQVILIAFGETVQLTATIRDSNGQPLSDAVVTWQSSNPEVAVVSDSGLVTSVANGAATITAHSGDLSARSEIRVQGPDSDRAFLSAIYNALGGPNWSNAANWNSKTPLGQWHGVTTNAEDRVTALNLGNNRLRGVIPPEIGQLADLEGLALDGNRLTGSIPSEIGLLSNLKHLYLSSNQLSGAIPPELGNLKSLLHLCLDRNRISGSVPEELGSLTNLKWLHLYENFDLSGPLPEAITGLKLSELLLQNTLVCAPTTERFEEWLESIEFKQVASCGEPTVKTTDREALVAFYYATGGPGWKNSTNWLSDKPLRDWHEVTTDENGRVTELSFWENNLSGSIPPELGQLTNLKHLYIAKNHLSGSIPTELGQLQNLEILWLFRNRISGSIPAELGQLRKLKVLNLDGNRLVGSIPPELGQLQNLETLELGSNPGRSSNQLIGSIPVELGQLQNLTHLDLRNNRLSGSIPAELGQFPNLARLDLGGNELTSFIPTELGKLRNLIVMGLTGNQLTGEIPPELSRLSKLENLSLDKNRLEGSVPSELGKLSHLTLLLLSENEALAGPVPIELTNLSNLVHFSLSGTQLCVPPDEVFTEWLRKIPRLDTTGRPEDVVRCRDGVSRDKDVLITLYNAAGGTSWNDNTNWLGDLPLNQWYGIMTSESDRVASIDLGSNNLVGRIPVELGDLSKLRHLTLESNPGLFGPVPRDLSKLNLESLSIEGTALCIPDDDEIRAWIEQLSEDPVSACALPSTDREVLIALYHATGGNNWTNKSNWLSDLPLDQWHGVSSNAQGEVTILDLSLNGLTGEIPPELGQLNSLVGCYLSSNQLTGSIPPELGRLTNLRALVLGGNRLTGSIPPELGRLTNLRRLELSHQGYDAVRHTFDGLTGEIPSELGKLSNLKALWLSQNKLSGSIPPELGQLTNLWGLFLNENQLSGAIPPEIGNLERLTSLELDKNPDLSGPLPQALVRLLDLRNFQAIDTGLCIPQNAEFLSWLNGISRNSGTFGKGLPDPCPLIVDLTRSAAYLTQSVQSFKLPVPLVAGEPALLRVFLTSDGTVTNKPAMKATFFHDGAEVHSSVISSGGVKVPDQVDESSLSISSNVLVPKEVIRPGLEFVVEIGGEDDQSTILGSIGRIPETGMIEADVREMPAFDLTMVPLLWTEEPDFSTVTETDGLTADSDLFRLTRDLLPVQEFELNVREPVYVSSDPVFGSNNVELLGEVEAIRTLDGADGYYMGVYRGEGSLGLAWRSGVVSLATLNGSTIAHELGHNLSLGHAPCDLVFGTIGSLDPSFPYKEGNIGAWGFDLLSNALVYPSTSDLMSYCDPVWISDYHFAKMIEYRLTKEEERLAAASSPPLSKSLLMWGGLSEDRGLYLEPVLAVDASASLPHEGGPYRLQGHDASGKPLFELDFSMGEIADGEGGVFVFALPVRQGWSGLLARITLTGPEGIVEMTREDDRSAALLLDPSSGRVRGILRDWPEPGASVTSARRVLPESNLNVVISKGIPEVGDW